MAIYVGVSGDRQWLISRASSLALLPPSSFHFLPKVFEIPFFFIDICLQKKKAECCETTKYTKVIIKLPSHYTYGQLTTTHDLLNLAKSKNLELLQVQPADDRGSLQVVVGCCRPSLRQKSDLRNFKHV